VFLHTVNTCYRLDLASSPKTWDTFPKMPLEIAYTALAFVPAVNRLYAIGGETGVSGFSTKVMVFDFAAAAWSFTGKPL
jgi:N-acetylneuraminic acid mutarotase